MRGYRPDAPPLWYTAPNVRFALLGAATAVLAALFWFAVVAILGSHLTGGLVSVLFQVMLLFAAGMSIVSICSLAISIGLRIALTDADRIRYVVLRGLCCSAYGNPLHLQAGELLPIVTCKLIRPGVYALKIAPGGTDIEAVAKLAPHISAVLRGRFQDYAVTLVNSDNALIYVQFELEDVQLSRALTVGSVDELRPGRPTDLIVQRGTYIDLTTSGSMLFAGKTRSGKTTAIISLILQVLLSGRDDFGSEVMIIDPKQAELSRLPHVITLDENGEASGILDALQHFGRIITKRQQILNDLSEQSGDAVHWWEAGMHPSLLFLDEYVACRSLFPQKAVKGNEDYCLSSFDNLVKRIVTMGASAGCYVIISIAEASVQDGGLPSMLRSAMSTKVLLRPTMPEARLLWSAERLEALSMSARVYGPGDAWFSSTDGEHDDVSYVHFPHMKFRVYQELGRLLTAYYSD